MKNSVVPTSVAANHNAGASGSFHKQLCNTQRCINTKERTFVISVHIVRASDSGCFFSIRET